MWHSVLDTGYYYVCLVIAITLVSTTAQSLTLYTSNSVQNHMIHFKSSFDQGLEWQSHRKCTYKLNQCPLPIQYSLI